MYGNNPPPPPTSTPAAGSGSGSRYNYLVSRLRNRQITMEEATELFALMQAMIARANEIARATAMRSSTAPSVPVAPVPEAPKLATGPSSSDDLLLVGILAMGAGAGLIAALSKRMAEGPPAPPSGPSKSGVAPR